MNDNIRARDGAWRIRQLIDGRYVAEERRGWLFKRWIAVDLRSPNFTWGVNCQYYKDCIGDTDQCLKALAGRGHSMQEIINIPANTLENKAKK